MTDDYEIFKFYKENNEWLEHVVADRAYPKFMRAMAGAVIEYAVENGERGMLTNNEIPPMVEGEGQITPQKKEDKNFEIFKKLTERGDNRMESKNWGGDRNTTPTNFLHAKTTQR